MIAYLKIIPIAVAALLISSCSKQKASNGEKEKPNILWIVLEDTNPLMGCYGETRIKTPHIDRFYMKAEFECP